MQVCTRVSRNEALGQQYYTALDQLLTTHEGKPLTGAFFKAVKEVVAMEGRETCFGVPVIELAVKLINKVIYTYFLLHRNSISPLGVGSAPHAPRPTPHAPRPATHAPRPAGHATRPAPHAPRQLRNRANRFFTSFLQKRLIFVVFL